MLGSDAGDEVSGAPAIDFLFFSRVLQPEDCCSGRHLISEKLVKVDSRGIGDCGRLKWLGGEDRRGDLRGFFIIIFRLTDDNEVISS